MSAPADTLGLLIQRWKADAGAIYGNWFLWDERLKNFRSIRRGLTAVVREIDASTFGTAVQWPTCCTSSVPSSSCLHTADTAKGFVEPDVDKAGHRVGSVNGRGTITQHIDAPDGGGREG